MSVKIGAGLAALFSFFMFNVIQQTPFKLNEFQQGVLMLIGLVAAAVALNDVFPSPPPRQRTRIVYVEKPEETRNIPDYGTADSTPPNPNAGLPDHDRYGL